jgi:hypothetical protein
MSSSQAFLCCRENASLPEGLRNSPALPPVTCWIKCHWCRFWLFLPLFSLWRFLPVSFSLRVGFFVPCSSLFVLLVEVSRLVAWPIVVDLLSVMSQAAEINRGRRQQEPDTFSVPLSNKKCSFYAITVDLEVREPRSTKYPCQAQPAICCLPT